MLVPVGSLVNAGAVVLGGLFGLAAGGFVGEKLRGSIFQTLGICTLLIGFKMALTADNVMIVIVSCVLGMITGELCRVEQRFNDFGDRVKKVLRSKNEKFTDGLVNTTLLTCVGAMAIVGSFEEGLGGSAATLFSKSILDFFAAIMFASAYGSGVVFAAVPLLLYQGSLTLLAGSLSPYLTPPVQSALVASGGVMIIGIGVNLMGIKPVSVSNLLPALFYAVALAAVFS